MSLTTVGVTVFYSTRTLCICPYSFGSWLRIEKLPNWFFMNGPYSSLFSPSSNSLPVQCFRSSSLPEVLLPHYLLRRWPMLLTIERRQWTNSPSRNYRNLFWGNIVIPSSSIGGHPTFYSSSTSFLSPVCVSVERFLWPILLCLFLTPRWMVRSGVGSRQSSSGVWR